MIILFGNKRIRKICTDPKEMRKQCGQAIADQLQKRLDDLTAANRLSDMVNLPGKCHELQHNRDECLAVHLDKMERLIFQAANDPIPRKEDGGLDWTQIDTIRILEIKNYHGK